ncbi:MAG: alpha/beta hydrolase [Pseudomonadota bacterium]
MAPRLNRLAIALSSALAVSVGCAGSEYNRDITDTMVDGERLFVAGTLNAKSFREIERQLHQNPQLRVVVLEDIDGSIDDDVNLQTAMLIHDAGLDTLVPADGIIESGGVDLFCAGHNRIAERGARVGVHSWADEDGLEGGDLPPDSEEHSIYLAYFAEVGCPAEFYWFSLEVAPSHGMHYMTDQELLDYGVATEIR